MDEYRRNSRAAIAWVFAVVIAIAIGTTGVMYVYADADEVTDRGSTIRWTPLVDTEYQISAGDDWSFEDLIAHAGGLGDYDWTELDDPYLLNNNGGYFMFCEEAISSSSEEHFTGAAWSLAWGEDDDGDALSIEVYRFEIEGAEATALLDRLAANASSCDDYFRDAPGWSFDRGSRQSIANVDRSTRCSQDFEALQVLEQPVGGRTWESYTYLASGDELVLIHLIGRRASDLAGVDCDIAGATLGQPS